eukprot:gene24302-32738_t
MSRSNKAAEDIWTKIDKEPKPTATNSATTDENGAPQVNITPSPSAISTSSTALVFVGDLASGKSTLIQTFLKPSVNTKDAPKPTIALDYNFARRTSNGVKSVANIWEVGGDLVEPRLIEIGITKGNFATSTVICVCDLSKPQNVLSSVLRSLEAVEEIAAERAAELKAVNVNALNDLREFNFSPYKDHPDSAKVKPLDVSVFIIGNKFDLFTKSVKPAERRAVMQVLRFVAHYFGAGILTVSGTSSDSSVKELYRSLLTNLCFNGPIRPMYEIASDKLVYITKAQDSFANILTESKSSAAAAADSKVRMLNESDGDKLLTAKGVTRDCWNRLLAQMVSIFGEPDPLSGAADGARSHAAGTVESSVDDESSAVNANPFPEPEIDDIRVLKDAELLRYVQETQRREEMLSKLNASNAAAGKG